MKARICPIVKTIWLLPWCTVSIVLYFHKHNSLPLGRHKALSPPLFCIFVNTTAYHLADKSFHLPLAVAFPRAFERIVRIIKRYYFVGCVLLVLRPMPRGLRGCGGGSVQKMPNRIRSWTHQGPLSQVGRFQPGLEQSVDLFSHTFIYSRHWSNFGGTYAL